MKQEPKSISDDIHLYGILCEDLLTYLPTHQKTNETVCQISDLAQKCSTDFNSWSEVLGHAVFTSPASHDPLLKTEVTVNSDMFLTSASQLADFLK